MADYRPITFPGDSLQIKKSAHAESSQEFVPIYPKGRMPNSKGMKLKQEVRGERIFQIGTPGLHVFTQNRKIPVGGILAIPGGGFVCLAHIGTNS